MLERYILFLYFKFRFWQSRYRISGRKKTEKFVILWIDFRELLSLSHKNSQEKNLHAHYPDNCNRYVIYNTGSNTQPLRGRKELLSELIIPTIGHCKGLFTDLLVEPNPPPPCDTQHPAYEPPHNNPFYISHDTPSPSTAVRGFGVLGLIIHFLTASSVPSPHTSWEHSRHNFWSNNEKVLGNVLFVIWQHDAVAMSLCLGLGLDRHILTYIISCLRLLGSL